MMPAQGVPASATGANGGTVYTCNIPGVQGTPGYIVVPPGQEPSPALVDPRVLAQQALEQLPLATPKIETAPAPPDMSYVSLETWLWMDPGVFEPVTASAAAGPTTVTATARPVAARWTTGDGGSTTCGSAGRPWVKGMTDAARTDCSYTWVTPSNSEPGGVFDLTSTLTYEVTWTCAGACLITNGDLGAVPGPSATGALRVGERQSVVVRG